MPSIFDQFAKGNKGRSSTVVAARPVDHHSFSRANVQFDDDIGLPMMDDMASNSTTATIWDEMEHELRSQVPQDPTPPGNGMQKAELSQEEKRIRLKAVQEELLFTLASRCNGYASLEDLKRDFQVDSGYIADLVADEHGYQKFEDFANSELMKSVIKLAVIDGQPTYVPRDCTKFKHIRDEQMISNDCTVKKEDDEEMEKLARALLPENAEQFIKGKKIILKMLYELGGETSQVLWVRIQEKYKLDTGKELAGQELRSLFQRDKALKILTKYFQNDINVWDTNSPGHYWLQLKRPYREIMQSFDEMIRAQKEAVNRYRTNKRRPPFTSNKVGKPPKLTLEERLRPGNSLFTPHIDQSVFMEQGTSKSVAKPPPKSTGPVDGPRAVVDDDIGLELPPTNPSVINKPKFQIPSDAIKPKLDGTGNNSSPSQKNAQKTGFDWDGDSLTHYDEDVDHNQKTTAKSSSSNKANVNNNKKKVKGIAYTSRDKGTYTDSEEEADNDDDARSDVTLMPRKDLPQNEGCSRRRAAFDDVLNEPPTSNNQTNTFAADDRPNGPNPVGHQKNIQKYMKTLMEQKGPIPIRPPNSSIFNSGQVISDRKQPFVSSADDKNVVDNMETDISVTVPPGGAPDGHSQSDKRQAPNCGPNFEAFPSNWDSRRLNVREEVLPCEPLRPGPAFSMYSRPSTDCPKGFQLMEHVEQLRNIANKNGLSHETRFDEGSFSFRRGDKLLIFTEFNEEKVRGSWHNSGRIYNERYYPKVDWEMFCATIRGLLCDTFVSLSNMDDSRLQLPFECDSSSGSTGSLNGLPSSARSKTFSWGCPPSFDNTEKFVEWGTPPDFARENPKTRGNSFVSPLASKWVLPEVPDKFRTGGGAPFPLFKRTVDGRAFLCFFTKVYAFSNHHPAVFRIEDSLFCCSEQYYMWRKTKHFGFDRTAEEIMEIQHTGTIKRLGTADTLRERRRIGMEPNSREFDHDEWRKVKEEIMLTALRAKFTQNAKMLRMLVDTCDAVLVEASPTDTYWGVGRAIDSEEIEDPQKWRGTNRLGILLQRLRMELQYR